jgi:hypothetical protein
MQKILVTTSFLWEVSLFCETQLHLEQSTPSSVLVRHEEHLLLDCSYLPNSPLSQLNAFERARSYSLLQLHLHGVMKAVFFNTKDTYDLPHVSCLSYSFKLFFSILLPFPLFFLFSNVLLMKKYKN